MATNPKTQKQFLKLLFEKEKLPFVEVLELFSNANGKINRSAIKQTLLFLRMEDLFYIRKKGTKEIYFSSSSDAFFDSPEDCYIELNDLESSEMNSSDSYEGEIIRKDLNKISDHNYWAGIKQNGFLKIIGEPGNATNLAERIRVFTNYFAFNLVSRNLDKVETLFSKQMRSEYTAELLEKKLAKQESTYGTFDFFDHIEVISVFSGEKLETNVSSVAMKLPKGVSRKDRRGESTFQLVSVYTPNAITIHSYYIDLGIIEEAGVLKVCYSRWYTGGF